jgi:hypothetical protein
MEKAVDKEDIHAVMWNVILINIFVCIKAL